MRGTTRRNFLRGAGGLTVGLPMLSSLQGTARARGADGPRHLVVMFHPQGMIMDEWHPTGVGTDFTLPAILAPLEAHRDDIVVVSGLDNQSGMLNTNGGHHSAVHLLTGMPMAVNLDADGDLLPAGSQPMLETGQITSAAGPSIDQVIAQRMAAPTPYRSLELAVGTTSYLDHIAVFFGGAEDPLDFEPDPHAAFDRLFDGFDPGTPSTLQKLRAARGSVLDLVGDSYESLAARASATDRQLLEEHATRIRELEARLGMTGSAGLGCAIPQYTLPGNYDPHHADFDADGARAQIDIMVMALACDLTRVASLHFTHGQDNRFPWLGYPIPFPQWSDWHGMIHIVPDGPTARDDPQARPAMIAAMTWYTQQFAYLLQRMAETPDGDGSLLDSSLVVWVSDYGDGAAHNTNDIPVVLAGNLCGALQTGRHLDFTGRSTNDLLVSILNLFGYEDETFGWPTICAGALPGLA
jgi:hypothetical protein